jgi:hypothetical protein
MKPHKHAELIKAWADGADIEHFSVPAQIWMYTARPAWNEDNNYRIKPEPKPDLRLFYWVSDHVVQCSSKIHMHNLALTFDGNTGELTFAEVLK